MTASITILALLIGIPLVIFLIAGLAYLGIKAAGGLFKAIGWLFMHVWRFVAGVLGDSVRFVGAVLTMLAFVPLTILNVAVGRWSAAAHFGKAVQGEIFTAGQCLYRVGVGHPLRFLLLGGVTEGLEQRLPAAVAAAPGSDKPSKRSGQFDGYTIIGSLRGGGSGGRLYIAEPDETKRLQLARAGAGDIDQVVIKTFSVHDGSSMPQIVRESRALEAARKMGLVIEHELTEDRFFYVMRYVPGDTLGVVAERLHAESGPGGLRAPQLASALGYVCDLLNTIEVYHRGGLWHKDIKPDNIIVHNDKAHLVDLGLVTPLRSAMTLTTHGTEYFRDPEMVRLALRGAKVHEVDGVKFDVYGAGAVLYSVVENSFPAHGGLSQLKNNCPEALRWIVRRSMAETQQRYASAAEMLADLRVVQRSADPFTLKPKDLPSVMGDPGAGVELEPDPMVMNARAAAAAAGTPLPRVYAEEPPAGGWFDGGTAKPAATATPDAVAVASDKSGRPKLSVLNWWTGRYSYSVDQTGAPPVPPGPAHGPHGPARRIHTTTPADLHPHAGTSAREQLKRARARAARTQQRANARMQRHAGRYSNKPNPGVWFAGLIFLAVVGGVVIVGLSDLNIGGNNGGPAYRSWMGTEAQRFTVQIGPNKAMTVRAHMPPTEFLAPTGSPSAPPALNGQSVLLLDLAGGTPQGQATAERFARLGARLRRDGVPTFDVERPNSGEEDAMLLAMGAQAIVDLTSFGQDRHAAYAWARGYLAESDLAAAILWRERPEPSDEEPRIHLLTESQDVTDALVPVLMEAKDRRNSGDLDIQPPGEGTSSALPGSVKGAATREVPLDLTPYPHGAVVLHYHRPDGDYADWEVWAWTPHLDGEAHGFNGRTDFGRYTVFPRRASAQQQLFVIRKGNWEAKDWDKDRSFMLDGRGGVSEAWVVSGDPRVFRDPVIARIAAETKGAEPTAVQIAH